MKTLLARKMRATHSIDKNWNAHGNVERSHVRHVYPFRRLLDAGRQVKRGGRAGPRRMDAVSEEDSARRIRGSGQGIQPGRLGSGSRREAGCRCRYEVFGEHGQAPPSTTSGSRSSIPRFRATTSSRPPTAVICSSRLWRPVGGLAFFPVFTKRRISMGTTRTAG